MDESLATLKRSTSSFEDVTEQIFHVAEVEAEWKNNNPSDSRNHSFQVSGQLLKDFTQRAFKEAPKEFMGRLLGRETETPETRVLPKRKGDKKVVAARGLGAGRGLTANASGL